ncbi:hypothetical protein ABZZ37_16135 [Streptomyces sp. NPDC006464]|uniref:hypothetical protein n=1 Tax=Streptomyces sp. NPDC006464 TaxID=3154305 RepID=UPI0033A3C770
MLSRCVVPRERDLACPRNGPAVFSAAGILGGTLFVRFPPATAPRPPRLAVLPGLYAACWLPLLPAALLLTLAVLPGALLVPVLTEASLTHTFLTPPGTSIEAGGSAAAPRDSVSPHEEPE